MLRNVRRSHVILVLSVVLFGFIVPLDIYLWRKNRQTVVEAKEAISPISSPPTAAVQPGSTGQSYKNDLDAFWARTPHDQERNLEVSAMVAAIRHREERFSDRFGYGSHNPSGATGITQVMPASLKEWSVRCLGREVSQTEYQGNNLAQILISHCQIGRLWDNHNHDSRVVASCWFSGRTDFNGVSEDSENTPVNRYVADVMANLAKVRPDLVSSGSDSENKPCKW